MSNLTRALTRGLTRPITRRGVAGYAVGTMLALTLLAGTSGLALASMDNSFAIVDSGTPANNYVGDPGAKLTTTRASTASYWDVDGLLKFAANNTLRRDFDPRLASTVERCGYLIEEARTNLALRSEDFTTTWTNSSTTETADQSVAPDGTTTMDRVTCSAANAAHYILQTITWTNAIYTVSVFVRYTNHAFFQITMWDGTTSKYCNFNLQTGALSGTQSNGTGTITSVGNGIYRLTFTTTAAQAAAGGNITFAFISSGSGSANETWNAAGTETVDLWGAQVEAGSFASSYIPTAGSTVTRAADLVTLAGTLFPLSTSEGTMYAKVMPMGTGANNCIWGMLDDGTSNEVVVLLRASDQKLYNFVIDGGSTLVSLNSTATIANLLQGKAAVAYKANDCAAALLGETVQTDISNTMPTPTKVVFGNRSAGDRAANGWILEFAYFPTRKTNSQLQALASGYASDALLLMGAETQGLTFSASDQSMSILDTGTPANAYSGELSAKLGSIRTSAGMTYLSSGLLGWGPENLLLRSQQFDNASWAKDACSIGADAIAAPDGTTTADANIPNSGSNSNGLHQNGIAVGSGLTCTFSGYVKNGTLGNNWLEVTVVASSVWRVWFNLATGAKGTSSGSPTSYNIAALSNGWYRVDLTVVTAATNADVYFSARPGENSNPVTGDGVSPAFYVWGAQLERAASASTYKPTTSAAYYGLRLDYDSRLTGGPGYLVEEARTNLALRSQEFDNATAWATVSNLAIVANDRAAPDGTTTAEKITNDTVNGAHRLNQGSLTTTAVPYTLSIYARAGTGNIIQLALADGTTLFYANFLLGSAAVGNKHASVTATIQAVADGYYRCTMTMTPAATASASINIALLEADTASYNPSYVGTTVNMHIWGAQLEAGAFATSYIPTTSATVTRAADLPTLATTLFPYSQSIVSLYARVSLLSVSPNMLPLQFDDGTSNNRILVRLEGNVVRLFVIRSGGTEVSITATGLLTALTKHKIAGTSTTNDAAETLNGATVVTDSSVTMPSGLNILRFGHGVSAAEALNGWLCEGGTWPVRKSNAQLQALAA